MKNNRILCIALALCIFNKVNAEIQNIELKSNNSTNENYATLKDTLNLTINTSLDSKIKNVKIAGQEVKITSKCTTNCSHSAKLKINQKITEGLIPVEITETLENSFDEVLTTLNSKVNYVNNINKLPFYSNLVFDSTNKNSTYAALPTDNIEFSIDLHKNSNDVDSFKVGDLEQDLRLTCKKVNKVKKCSALIPAQAYEGNKVGFMLETEDGTITSKNDPEDFVYVVNLGDIDDDLNDVKLLERNSKSYLGLDYPKNFNNFFQITKITNNDENIDYQVFCGNDRCKLTSDDFKLDKTKLADLELEVKYSVLNQDYKLAYKFSENPAAPVKGDPMPKKSADKDDSEKPLVDPVMPGQTPNEQPDGMAETPKMDVSEDPMPIVITPKPDQDQAPVVTVSEPEFEILNTYENLEIAALGNLPVVYKVKGSNEVVFAAAQLTNQENLTSTLEYENKNYDLNVDNLNLNTLKEKKYNKRAAKLPELETIRVNKKGKVVLIGKNLRNKANLTLVFEDGTDQLVNLKNLNRRKTRQKVKLGNLPADIKYFVYTHKKFGAAFAKYEADQ